jgi:hypothetical protein
VRKTQTGAYQTTSPGSSGGPVLNGEDRSETIRQEGKERREEGTAKTVPSSAAAIFPRGRPI